MLLLPLLLIMLYRINCSRLKRNINRFISIFNGIWKIVFFHQTTTALEWGTLGLDDDNDDNDFHEGANSKYNALGLHNLTFDKKYLVQSNSTLFLDIRLIVQEKIIVNLKDNGKNYFDYFRTMFNGIQQIFSWNKINLRVISFEKITFQFEGGDIKNRFLTEIDKAYINEKRINPDLTIFLYYSGFTWNLINKYNFFCHNKSLQMINLHVYKHDLKRLIIEKIIDNWTGRMFKYFNDDKYKKLCKCAYELDIMCLSIYRSGIYTRPKWPPKIQMNCETEYLLRLFHKHPCLFEKHEKPNLFVSCGNGILDPGEECDCGHEFQCNHTGQWKCCYYDTCRFKDRSFQCSYGECCENCQFSKHKICRKSFGECDIDEMCNGSSSECPPDIVYENYAMCNNNEGFCWNGMCTNHKDMCSYVYDTDDISFSQHCYDNLLDTLKFQCNQTNIPLNILPLCNTTDICSHFICATSHKFEEDYLIYIKMSDLYCVIPKNIVAIGALAYAPNHVKCSNQMDHFCHNSKCTSDKNQLKNCHNNMCYPINNKLSYPMTKNVPLDSHGFQYLYLGIYLLVKEKISIPIIIYKPPVGLYIGILIAIILFVLIIALVFCILKRRKKTIAPINKPNNSSL